MKEATVAPPAILLSNLANTHAPKQAAVIIAEIPIFFIELSLFTSF